eukprot:GHVL01009041.1.p2 GENE.GHVL01009041.1~~GHVL01009041.1.p2  ORF type:complete len:1139 (+),score=141.69 GHVL01009041.1:1473-4889(+)
MPMNNTMKSVSRLSLLAVQMIYKLHNLELDDKGVTFASLNHSTQCENPNDHSSNVWPHISHLGITKCLEGRLSCFTHEMVSIAVNDFAVAGILRHAAALLMGAPNHFIVCDWYEQLRNLLTTCQITASDSHWDLWRRSVNILLEVVENTLTRCSLSESQYTNLELLMNQSILLLAAVTGDTEKFVISNKTALSHCNDEPIPENRCYSADVFIHCSAEWAPAGKLVEWRLMVEQTFKEEGLPGENCCDNIAKSSVLECEGSIADTVIGSNKWTASSRLLPSVSDIHLHNDNGDDESPLFHTVDNLDSRLCHSAFNMYSTPHNLSICRLEWEQGEPYAQLVTPNRDRYNQKSNKILAEQQCRWPLKHMPRRNVPPLKCTSPNVISRRRLLTASGTTVRRHPRGASLFHSPKPLRISRSGSMALFSSPEAAGRNSAQVVHDGEVSSALLTGPYCEENICSVSLGQEVSLKIFLESSFPSTLHISQLKIEVLGKRRSNSNQGTNNFTEKCCIFMTNYGSFTLPSKTSIVLHHYWTPWVDPSDLDTKSKFDVFYQFTVRKLIVLATLEPDAPDPFTLVISPPNVGKMSSLLPTFETKNMICRDFDLVLNLFSRDSHDENPVDRTKTIVSLQSALLPTASWPSFPAAQFEWRKKCENSLLFNSYLTMVHPCYHTLWRVGHKQHVVLTAESPIDIDCAIPAALINQTQTLEWEIYTQLKLLNNSLADHLTVSIISANAEYCALRINNKHSRWLNVPLIESPDKTVGCNVRFSVNIPHKLVKTAAAITGPECNVFRVRLKIKTAASRILLDNSDSMSRYGVLVLSRCQLQTYAENPSITQHVSYDSSDSGNRIDLFNESLVPVECPIRWRVVWRPSSIRHKTCDLELQESGVATIYLLGTPWGGKVSLEKIQLCQNDCKIEGGENESHKSKWKLNFGSLSDDGENKNVGGKSLKYGEIYGIIASLHLQGDLYPCGLFNSVMHEESSHTTNGYLTIAGSIGKLKGFTEFQINIPLAVQCRQRSVKAWVEYEEIAVAGYPFSIGVTLRNCSEREQRVNCQVLSNSESDHAVEFPTFLLLGSNRQIVKLGSTVTETAVFQFLPLGMGPTSSPEIKVTTKEIDESSSWVPCEVHKIGFKQSILILSNNKT